MTEKSDGFSVSEDSAITIPLRNLIGMIFATAVVVMGYFQMEGRISDLEREQILLENYVGQNTEFRIKWPRGELGALPDDMMQNTRLDAMDKHLEELDRLEDLIQELRLELNTSNAMTHTQEEKIETLFEIWNNSLTDKHKQEE
jgi:hypothetical protein